ncbi:MAG: M14 family zinc carboxypeptidase, partial [bacterium]|nr:M14 family zinc carboxypeptidase [bacterium]
MSRYTIFRSAAALAVLAGSTAFAQPEGYMSNDQLQSRLQQIASNEHASLDSIGKSLGGSPLHLLTLSTGDTPRPALLIAAGIDAEYLVSTEIATRIAEELLEHHPSLLEEMTVYIIPRVNPDGAARNMGSVLSGHSGNARLVDE